MSRPSVQRPSRARVTAHVAAGRLGVSRETVYALIGEGSLPAIRNGANGPYRVQADAVDRFAVAFRRLR